MAQGGHRKQRPGEGDQRLREGCIMDCQSFDVWGGRGNEIRLTLVNFDYRQIATKKRCSQKAAVSWKTALTDGQQGDYVERSCEPPAVWAISQCCLSWNGSFLGTSFLVSYLPVIKVNKSEPNFIAPPSSHIKGLTVHNAHKSHKLSTSVLPKVNKGLKRLSQQHTSWAYVFQTFCCHKIISSDFTNLYTRYVAKGLSLCLSQGRLQKSACFI